MFRIYKGYFLVKKMVLNAGIKAYWFTKFIYRFNFFSECTPNYDFIIRLKRACDQLAFIVCFFISS